MLQISDLTKKFGGLVAIDSLDLEFSPGLILGLIGPNGAGKTTLINLITGSFPATAGHIHFRGQDITNWKPHRIAGLGVTRTFQNIHLFGHMTVMENVLVGQHRLSVSGLASLLPGISRSKEKAFRREAEDLLGWLGLYGRRDIFAGELPYADQRRLEIARALASKPELILLDEPAAGMDEQESAVLAEQIKEIKDMGCTVILIEHDMSVVLRISDRVAVLNFGKKIADGPPNQVKNDQAVVEAYLGKEEEST